MYLNLSEETGRNNRYFSEDNSSYFNQKDLETIKTFPKNTNEDNSSYFNQKDLEPIKTSPKNINEEKKLQGADGTKYLYSPFLTEEVGKKVEEETGLFLKREENGKVSSFLG